MVLSDYMYQVKTESRDAILHHTYVLVSNAYDNRRSKQTCTCFAVAWHTEGRCSRVCAGRHKTQPVYTGMKCGGMK